MTKQTNNIPDWLLEKFVLNELTAGQKKAVEEYISKKSTEAEARINKIKQSNIEIINTYQPSNVAREINRRLKQEKFNESIEKSTNRNWIKQLTLAAPGLAVLLVVFYFAFLPTNIFKGKQHDNKSEIETIRLKGIKPFLRIYRKNGDKIEPLKKDSLAKEADILQLSYISAKKEYGFIVSIDGRNTITKHFPENSNLATKLSNQGEILLPFSYQLDDAPDYEIFIFITSNEQFKIETVIDIMKKLSSTIANKLNNIKFDLPLHFEQSVFVLKKGIKI